MSLLRAGVQTRVARVLTCLALLCAFGLGVAPAAVAQITVTSRLDGVLEDLDGNGTCELREAIEAANANAPVGECPAGAPGFDRIEFNISGSELTIFLASDLPILNDDGEPVLLDGVSQPGASCPSTPKIVITPGDGGLDGLTLGDDNTVRGLVLNDFPGAGIVVNGSNNHIACTFIGTGPDGASAIGNDVGVHVEFGSDNVIGVDGDAINDDLERNLISGNGTGVFDEGFDTVIAGNFIGTDVMGLDALSNDVGIQIGEEVPGGALGKATPSPGINGANPILVKDNFIANNAEYGIFFPSFSYQFQSGSENNCIVGNATGVDYPGETTFVNNWWGAADGPSPGGSGDSAFGVDAEPFLTVPAKVCAFFTKTFTDDPVGPGGTVTLEFTITNPSPDDPFTAIAFTDSLDHVLEGLTALGLPENDVCGPGSLLTVDAEGTLELTGGGLSAGASCTFAVTVQVPPEALSGSYFNMTSELTGLLNGEPATVDAAGDTLIVSALLFSKSFTDDPVFPGGGVTLEFTITNAGEDDLERISFLDNVEAVLAGLAPSDGQLPLVDICGDGSTFGFLNLTARRKTLEAQTVSPLELRDGVLDAGTSCTFSLTLDVPEDADPGTYLNMTSEIDGAIVGTSGEGTVEGEPAKDFLDVLGIPVLIKEFTDDPVGPGGAVTLKFTLVNPDPQNPVREIAFSDDLEAVLAGLTATSFETTEGGDVIPINDLCGPGSQLDFTEASVLVFTGGSLDPDDSCMFSVTLAVPTDAAPDDYPNVTSELTAEVGGTSGTPGEPVTADAASDDLRVAPVPLFSKEFIDDPVLPGGPVTLRFTIVNTSPTEAVMNLAFTDDLDLFDSIDADPETDVLTTLGVGESLPKAVCTTGTLDETAGVLSLTGGSIPAGGSCTFDVLLDVPDEITVDPLNAPTFTTDLPPGTYLNTTSTLAATVVETNFEGSPASDDLVVLGLPVFSKSFADTGAEPGGTVVLTFTIQNPDPNFALTDIAFTDDLDAVLAGLAAIDTPLTDVCGLGSGIGGTSTLTFIGGSLDPASSCTFDVTLQIPAGAERGGFENTTSALTAMISGMGVEVEGAFDILNVGGSLLLTKEFTDDPVAPGGTVTLTFTLTNNDTETATDIAFLDNLDAMLPGIAVLTALPLFDVCGDGSVFGNPTTAQARTLGAQSLPPLELVGGTLDPGEMCMFSLELGIPPGATPGEYPNTTSEVTATIGDDEGVPSPSATDILIISAPLTILKSFTDDPAPAGGAVTLEFTITYEADDEDPDLTDIAFDDDLDAVLPGLTASAGQVPQSDVCGGGSALSESGGVLTLAGGVLSPGTFCTFSVVLDVPEDAPQGESFNNVTSDITGELPTPERPVAKVQETITGSPAMDDLHILAVPVIRKEFLADPVAPGGTTTLQFTITNNNDTEEATDISFTDDLDAALSGLVVVTGSPATAVCGAGSQLTGTSVLTLTGGSLGPGAVCTFSVTLAVPPGTPLGVYTNTTTALTAEVDGETLTGNTASDDLSVEGLPLLVKTFLEDPVAAGSSVVLEFTLTNTDPASGASAIAFTDDLAATLPGLAATDTPQSDVCGTGSSLTGTSVLTLTGGTLAAGASCTFSVTLDVPGAALGGSYLNTTSSVAAQVGGGPREGAPATDNLDVVPMPTLSKSFTDDPVLPGGTVTLDFTIDYGEGTASATNIAFTDDLDAALSGLVAVGLPASNVCGAGSQIDGTSVLTFTGGSLNPEASCTFSVTLQVPAAAEPGDYTNQTDNLTADVGGVAVTGSPASDNLHVLALALSKSFIDDPVIPGGMVTLEFTLLNADPDDVATNISFTDDLDAVLLGLEAVGLPASDVCGAGSQLTGTSLLTLTGGSLDPGASCTFSVTLQVPADAEPAEYTNITGSVTALLGDAEITEPGATDVLIVSETLTLAKSFTDDPVTPGGTVTLEFTVSYLGEGAATDIAFTDDLDAVLPGLAAVGLPASDVCGAGSQLTGTSLLTLTGGNLVSGTSCVFSVTLQVPGDAPDGSYLNTTSNVTAQVDGESAESGPATDVLDVATEAMLDVTKVDELVEPDGLAQPGDVLNYTVEVVNNGDRPANGVVFTDTVDPNTALDCGSVTPTPTSCTPGLGGSLTVDLGTLSQAESATIMFEVEIASPFPGELDTVANQGAVNGDNFAEALTDDPDTAAEDDPTVTEIIQQSDFALTKTADSATPDYQGVVVFTLTVTNNGPGASPAIVTDILPEGLVFVEADPAGAYNEATGVWETDVIAAGDSRVLTITALVDTLEPVTNEADVVSAGSPDPDESNNHDEVTITPTAADLAIVKTLLAFSGDPETNVITATFKLTVTNNGPSDATGVVVEDPLPEGATLNPVPAGYNPATGIWTIGDLADGASAMLTLVMTADAQYDLLNIAEVSGDQYDQDEDNNIAASRAQHENDPDELVADLSLTKTVDNEMPAVGDTITYTITLTNDGPSGTAGVAVFDGFPADSLLEFVSATTNTASGCCFDDSLWVWSVGAVPRGATKTLEIKAVVVGTGEITNTAEIIRSYLPDPDSYFGNGDPNDDDQDSATIVVSPAALSRGEVGLQESVLEASEAPSEFALESNYPNPFNPETVIPYAVAEASQVRIAVYNVLGREVAVLLDEERSVGRYALRWRADNLPTGMYLVRMQAGAFVQVRQILLIK